MAYYRYSNTKSTIAKPTTSADCRILLKRIDDEDTQKNTNLQEIHKKISALNDQLATIKSQLSQNVINKKFLSECLIKLESIEKANTYINRCRDFINTYNWIEEDDDDEEDEIENTLKTLPSDIFDFLKLLFAPLNSYTSDEIKKIAHYLKACELIKSSDNDNIPRDYTYGQIADTFYNYKYEMYIIGDIEGCHCGYDDCSDNYKRYGDVVTDLKDINLDSTDIICSGYRLD
jgi:chromosome segregation ATPase